jgi:uncharacterized protein YbaR (Trm112 family)
MPLSPELSAFVQDATLVDPKTFEVLVLSESGEWLEARATGRRFPIVDGIPRLLEEAAEPLP